MDQDLAAGSVVRVGALADLHCTQEMHGKLQPPQLPQVQRRRPTCCFCAAT